jgi:diadenosine tetraphosphate (Ap4A) HIT family hydrolase
VSNTEEEDPVVVEARKALEMFRKEVEDFSDDENNNNNSNHDTKPVHVHVVGENGTSKPQEEQQESSSHPKEPPEEAEADQRSLRWQKAAYRKPIISQQDDPCLL